ncbi:MAG: PepSY domain-containing protein [Pyrinomonadaceae bacterium]|nr:PepSY domain-containing protein [Pyrinomonadaceae bacterium]
MKFNLLNRKIHSWVSIIVAVPIIVIIASGLLLQVKKQVAWIQPAEVKGSGKSPEISLQKILESAKTVPEAKIETWDDVNRLDVRPSKGMVKVRAENDWEIQIDLSNGEVLQSAYRRSDIIESIHDGSFFHDYVKLWLFLPAGICLLALWLTGIYMFFQPRWARWRRSK